MSQTNAPENFPAFPQPLTYNEGRVDFPDQYGVGGMTLGDYFAAHAPEVPAWFYPDVLTALPTRPKGAEFCEGCKAGSDCEKTEPCKKAHMHKELVDHVKQIRSMETLTKWRYAYAEAMLHERKKAKL